MFAVTPLVLTPLVCNQRREGDRRDWERREQGGGGGSLQVDSAVVHVSVELTLINDNYIRGNRVSIHYLS